jgi:hypothetical protein
VEPDSLSAWLGLAGVGVGALLTAGVAWLQNRHSDRQDRRRQEIQAITDLGASAESLQMTVVALSVASQIDPNAIRDWVPAITGLLDRVHKADATIARLSKPPLVTAADALAAAARDYAHDFGRSGNTALTTAIETFSGASREVKG